MSNALMNNYYVVDAYFTSHWVTMIIYMKFKKVWYLDSAKQHPRWSSQTSNLFWTGQFVVSFVQKNSIF
jgi:hypothetical protein